MKPASSSPSFTRRAVLASLALGVFAAPPLASGCAASYAPISEIDGLRVVGISADKPYANAGDTVTFTLTYDDAEAYGTAPNLSTGGSTTTADGGTPEPARPLEVLWLAGCFDPAGDEYYGCYAPLAEKLAAIAGGSASGDAGASIDFGSLPPDGAIGSTVETELAYAIGSTAPSASPVQVANTKTFTLALPSDLISFRPPPSGNEPYYGIAYVFFAVCAGHLKSVGPEAAGRAGSFPFACFDDAGNQLGADSFVPGYTSVYAFNDGRTNANPEVTGLTVTNNETAVDVDGTGPVAACSVPEATRGASGCGHADPFKTCNDYVIQVEVPNDVAEVDPATKGENGVALREEVWVDYYADSGDLQDSILLVSDATLGIQKDFSTVWIPPPLSVTANLWAVVHDSRGGETVVQRQIVVQ